MKIEVVWDITQCVWKVTGHLQKVVEVMSISVYTGLNPFNFYSQTLFSDLLSESGCELIQDCESDVQEHLYRPEPVG